MQGEWHRRNARLLCWEVAWFALANGLLAFNGAYLLRLGGTDTLVGLLVSLPPLVMALAALPVGSFVENPRRTDWTWRWALVSRAGLALVAVLPLLKLGAPAIWTTVMLVALTLPAAPLNVSFHAMFMKAVPEERRASVVSSRNMLVGAGTALATYLGGRWLDEVPFPMNYQVLYLVAAATLVSSWVLLRQVHVPDIAPGVPGAAGPGPKGAASWLEALKTPGFGRMMAYTFLFETGAWLAAPLYLLVFVKQLGATDGWLGLNGAAGNIAVLAGFYLAKPLQERWGSGKILLVFALPCALYPLILGLAPVLHLALLLAVFNGLVSAIFGLSHYSVLLTLWSGKRPEKAIALYLTVTQFGAFLWPLVGVKLAETASLETALTIAGCVRMAGALLFSVAPVSAAISRSNDEAPTA